MPADLDKLSAIWSASMIVESLCAMTMVVRPRDSRSRATRTCATASASRALVASSSNRIGAVPEKRAGDREALSLPARQPVPANADLGVVAFGKGLDEIVGR
jgi:hypothetical protein